MSKKETVLHLNQSALTLIRIEYLMCFFISVYFFFINIESINWWLFIALFMVIDLVGYIPGMLRTLVTKNQVPERIFYILYNITHNLTVIGALVFMCWQMGWLDWSFLAIPIHLFGDRGVLGNFYKPYETPYNDPSIAPLRAAS